MEDFPSSSKSDERYVEPKEVWSQLRAEQQATIVRLAARMVYKRLVSQIDSLGKMEEGNDERYHHEG